MPQARSAAAPWIAGSVAALLMVAAVLAYFLIDSDDASSKTDETFTSQEAAAVSAAGTETANLLSFSRAHFAADFKRALAGATGTIKTDIAGKKADTLKTITDGKFDLGADVTHTALVGPAEKGKQTGYVVLVSLNGYKSTQKNLPTQQNLQVTVVKQKGKWLVSEVSNIGVGG